MTEIKRPNVFILVLDTLRPDQVKGAADDQSPENFLERQLQKGTLFRNYIVAGGTTRVSVNALFNGFYGETSGLNYQNCDKEFAQHPAINLAEVFKYNGYQTLAATQGDVSLQPTGFEHLWTRQESFDLDALQALLKGSTRPTFTYLHFYHVHDQAFGYPEKMTPENYRVLVNELAEEIEQVWSELIKEDDVVVIASDHGARLRKSFDASWRFYHEDEPTAGWFLSEQTIRGLCGIIAPGLFPIRKIDQLIRGIDIFPTLCDALKLERPAVQGRTLWPVLQGHESVPKLHAFIETGGERMASGQAICRSLRTENWKYCLYQTHGELLFDLQKDPLEEKNLIGSGHPQEARMKQLFAAQNEENLQGVEGFYASTAALCKTLRENRPPTPSAQSGARTFSFQRLIDQQVLDHLQAQLRHHLPQWKARGERVLLYSASDHVRHLLSLTDPEERGSIIGVIDHNPELQGQTYLGLPVFAPENFAAQAQPSMIIVAHHVYANEIYTRIKDSDIDPVPVRNLYQLDREIPLWWDRPAGFRQKPMENAACR